MGLRQTHCGPPDPHAVRRTPETHAKTRDDNMGPRDTIHPGGPNPKGGQQHVYMSHETIILLTLVLNIYLLTLSQVNYV